MSFMDVMYGPLGQVNNQFQNNLAQNAAGMNYSNNLVNSWQNVPQVDMTAWANATNNNMTNLTNAYIASNLAIGNGWGGEPGRVGTIGNETYMGSPAGQVQYGGPMPDIPYQNPFGGGWEMGADGQSRYTDPSAMGYGGIGSDAARVPQAAYNNPYLSLPVISQDWNTTFNNMTGGNNSAAYPLGDSSWYPQQQPAAQPDYSAWYGGLPGGAQAYNSWNMGLPAQGGFGVPGAGGGSAGSNFLSPGGGFSNSGADPWGLNAWAMGTPQGTREAVPDVRSYMPSGSFGGWPADTWGANSGYLGQTGLSGNGDTAALGGYPFGGYSSQDFMSIMGWPQAQGIGGSPLAGYGATPQADINNRWGGMQDPIWSGQGLTLGDQLRNTSANTLGWSDVDAQGQKHFLGQ